MSAVNENERFAGTEFTPFNDTKQPLIQEAVRNSTIASQGYDTRVFDRFRQGVSIRTGKHLYSSTQPKLWAGNIKHYTQVITYGQARDFTQYENSSIFEELPEFDPTWYLQDDNYPFPIIFNDGPQEEEEAIIEPFTIPFRGKSNENFHPRTPKAVLEDGNNFIDLNGGATRVEQFINYDLPTTARFFLDEGQAYFYEPGAPGSSIKKAIIIEGFLPIIERSIVPFDDTRDERIVEQINTSDQTFISRLKALDFDLSEDIRGTFDRKSSTAGHDVYGPQAARYGTDSIAYRGLIRGS